MKIGVKRAAEGQKDTREQERKPRASTRMGAPDEMVALVKAPAAERAMTPALTKAPSAAERAVAAVQRRHEAPLRAGPAVSEGGAALGDAALVLAQLAQQPSTALAERAPEAGAAATATSAELAAAVVEGAALPLEQVEAQLEKERALAALAKGALQPAEPLAEPAPEHTKGAG